MSVGWPESAARYLAGVALVALAWACPAAGRARDQLEIPEPCGTEGELEREVLALEQGDGAAQPRPRVHMRRDEAGFVLEVALPEGARTLRHPDCRALFRAAILIAALRGEGPNRATEATMRPDAEGSSAPASTNTKPGADRALERCASEPTSRPCPPRTPDGTRACSAVGNFVSCFHSRPCSHPHRRAPC